MFLDLEKGGRIGGNNSNCVAPNRQMSNPPFVRVDGTLSSERQAISKNTTSTLQPVTGNCFNTPGTKRMGNLTISTVSRPSPLANVANAVNSETPTTRLQPSLRTPVKRVLGANFATPIQNLDDKENCPPSMVHIQAQPQRSSKLCDDISNILFEEPDQLYSSPVFLDHQAGGENHLRDRTDAVDWDALESLVRLSSGENSGFATPKTQRTVMSRNLARLQNCTPAQSVTASERNLEEILFSQDPVESDIFLGYNQVAEIDELFQLPRPRSSSMVSVQAAKKSNIEIKVCSDKKRLPLLRGSNLRRIIIPAPAPAQKKHKAGRGDDGYEEDDGGDPRDYQEFITKLVADELVDSEQSDDDFDAFEEEPEEEDVMIPRNEIENLFDDCKDEQLLSKVLAARPLAAPSKESWEELKGLFRSQLSRHFQLLVQMLALSNEIRGGESHSILFMKLISQLKDEFYTEEMVESGLCPPGLKNFNLLLQSIPDATLRRQLSLVSRDDPMLRPKSRITTNTPVYFKHATADDPYRTSKAFTNLIALFNVDFEESISWNPEAESLVDNTKGIELLGTQPVKALPDPYSGKRTDCFLKCEDELLLVGLKRFGFGNWEMIHARFLPTRTTKQISTRYKNLVARRAKPNPIKDFMRELEAPLSQSEEALIYQGIKRFGKDFKLISQHFLPHRPPTILRNLWTRLDELRRQSYGNDVDTGGDKTL